jgi:hypothetical protein
MSVRLASLCKKIASFVLASAALAPAVARADVPSSVKIRSISYAGSGCAAGGIRSDVPRGFTAFRLYFSGLVAEAGPGIPLADSRRNCQVLLDLQFPAGWSFTVASLDYRGFVDLDAGASVTQTSTYYFQGDARQARLSTTIRGPYYGDFRITDTLGVESQVWSPCGATRALNVNIAVRADSRRSYGLIDLERATGRVTQIYGLTWRRCS